MKIIQRILLVCLMPGFLAFSATLEELEKNFATLDPHYGGVPLWWWDGEDLDKERMTWQLEELKSKGVPSVCFIQKFPAGPPKGPQVSYFSEGWWDYMVHTAKECQRLGMELWVHDETYHHSQPYKRYWQNVMEAELDERPELQGYVLDRVTMDTRFSKQVLLEWPKAWTLLTAAAFPRLPDGSLDLEKRVDLLSEIDQKSLSWQAPEGEWHISIIGYTPHSLSRTSRAAVDRFMHLHHNEYKRRLGDMVGTVLVGTFQDELQILRGRVPCDDRFIQTFENNKGYDPVEWLIGLYEDIGPQTEKFRCDYYDVLVDQLEANWFKPLYEWHEQHNMLFSHDNFGRNDIAGQTVQYGDYYRTMRWYQVPGYDDSKLTTVGSGNFFDAKLAASIAALYKRPRVWNEAFHTSGWGVSPELQYGAILENMCYGANLYDKHGLYYSILGGWYEQAPPDVHFRQPYWLHSREFYDSVTRLSYLFSQGTAVADVALLYPIKTMHANWLADQGITEPAKTMSDQTRTLAKNVWLSGTDMVFIDDQSIQNAEIRNKKLVVSGLELPVLMLGPNTTLSQSTLAKARSFYDQGGIVIAVQQLAHSTAEKGRNDPGLENHLLHVFGRIDKATLTEQGYTINRNDQGGTGLYVQDLHADWATLLDRHVERDVLTEPGIFHTHRQVQDGQFYLLQNVHNTARTVQVRLRATGQPRQWNAFTATSKPIFPLANDKQHTRLELDFSPYEAKIIVLSEGKQEIHLTETSLAEIARLEKKNRSVSASGWTVTPGVQTLEANMPETIQLSSAPVRVPEPLTITGKWDFNVKPVLNNRWGDFSYPAKDMLMQPEIREFHYHQEGPEEDGIVQGWMTVDHDDHDWTVMRKGYGPYFWMSESRSLQIDPPAPPDMYPSRRWQPYVFSKSEGKPGTHPDDHGFDSIVSDDYVLTPPGSGLCYFWTTLRVDEKTSFDVLVGPHIRQLWIEGKTVLPAPTLGDTTTFSLPLDKGTNRLMLAIEPGVKTFIALEKPDENLLDLDMTYVPRVRWFYKTTNYELDFFPWDAKRVGWMRFQIPAGTRAFTVPVAGQTQIWVDGKSVQPSGDTVTLGAIYSYPRQVAVRVDMVPGVYGGAMLTDPIQLDTESIVVGLEDWRDLGYQGYSGFGVYSRMIDLPEFDPKDKVILDLGKVAVSAKVFVNDNEVGGMANQPFRLDISKAAQPGKNKLRIEVANTVANHLEYKVPTRYVFPGQKESGLYGPVTISIQPWVNLTQK